jgi:hypothetical protein
VTSDTVDIIAHCVVAGVLTSEHTFSSTLKGGPEMAHHELKIRYKGDRYGWRVEGSNGQFKANPTVNRKDTVRWHSPEADACIVVLDQSPFLKNGKPIVDEVIKLSSGDKTEKFEIAGAEDGLYGYAVLVRVGEHDYTYVRGAESPPAVIVGG